MYRKILVPLDGSELAECALNHAAKLLRDGLTGEIVLLNAVVADIPWRALNVGEEGHSITFDINTVIKSFMEQSRKYLVKSQIPVLIGVFVRGDQDQDGVDTVRKTFPHHHGLRPEERHRPDCHGYPRIYRHAKDAVGQHRLEGSARVAHTGAFNQTGGLRRVTAAAVVASELEG